MKTNCLLAGVALIIFAAGPATGQSAPTPGVDNQFKCWDAAKNEVRDRLAGTPNLPSTSPSTTGSTGSTTRSGATTGSGSPASDAMASPGVTNPGGVVLPAPSGRPQEAVGLPVC